MATDGYFDDGTAIGLQEFCLLDPSYRNSPITSIANNQGNVRVFRVGMDYLRLRVKGGCLRHSQGDGEWYGYNLLKDLGESGLGTLGIEDRDYPEAYFTGGSIRVQCGTADDADAAWVDYELDFLQSVQPKTVSIGAAAGSCPAAPGEYADRNSNRTYTFDGTSLGTISGEGLEISVHREVVANAVPKCYGIRIDDNPMGLEMQIALSMSYLADTHGDWNEWWMELVTNKGDAPASLVGNGNTFTDCHIQDASAPQGADQFGHMKPGNFTISLLKDLN